ncbi:regulator of rDNA transcription 14 [Metschnikowia bicuspidata var. bicuspidata NRRL YB-4993]|uniref:Regulator of rDNA transcription 14 n=1 Tax=Metschnikowia bicuspidata var. bicuspidata NRRL YB-4993 TaxID=869754 RepID=A0A1A0H6Z8_9ASCO|nr:regulator of rDNA transcription 14 [Metschnikowia bicuspidata var. bicuspidata NRRL YB-4993]OBA19874.1 regulator of rDNA transcription 14 [Metschnikowia bicuspidata var. bicuspidata NRRL YB-4993]
MAFSSDLSKTRSQATLNKLFENMLPGSTTRSNIPLKKISTTENFSREVSKKRLSKEEIKKANKIEKAKRNKQLNKNLEKEKLFSKNVKYNVIKSHKNSQNISEEEQKYLKKLIKKNSFAVRRAGGLDDPMIKDEVEELRSEILALTNEKYDRSKERQQKAKLSSFNEKVKSGVLTYPGLTPGLAPVDYDESDDE